MSDNEVHLPGLLSTAFGISTSEARRGLAQGAVRTGDGDAESRLDVPRDELRRSTLRFGRRRAALLDDDGVLDQTIDHRQLPRTKATVAIRYTLEQNTTGLQIIAHVAGRKLRLPISEREAASLAGEITSTLDQDKESE